MEHVMPNQSMLETALDNLSSQAALISEHLMEVERLHELESIRDRANAFARGVASLCAAQRRLAKVTASLNHNLAAE